jgi:hypothetical protein
MKLSPLVESTYTMMFSSLSGTKIDKLSLEIRSSSIRTSSTKQFLSSLVVLEMLLLKMIKALLQEMMKIVNYRCSIHHLQGAAQRKFSWSKSYQSMNRSSLGDMHYRLLRQSFREQSTRVFEIYCVHYVLCMIEALIMVSCS